MISLTAVALLATACAYPQQPSGADLHPAGGSDANAHVAVGKTGTYETSTTHSSDPTAWPGINPGGFLVSLF